MSSSSEASSPKKHRARPYLVGLLLVVVLAAAMVTAAPVVARAREQGAARRALAAELAASAEGLETLRALSALEEQAARVSRDGLGSHEAVAAGAMMMSLGPPFRLAVLRPLEEGGRGGVEAADHALRSSRRYPEVAREALWAAVAVMSDSWEGPVSREPTPSESRAIAYAACALADAVALDPVAPWLARAITSTRQRAVTLVRESLDWVPPREGLGRALDEMVLEQNRVFVRVIAERRRQPSDPLVEDLLTDSDESVAAGAFVRICRDLEQRLRDALAESGPVAERLRQTLLEAGIEDPRGGLGDYLRQEPPPFPGALGPLIPPDEPRGAIGALPAGDAPRSVESSR